jgi:transcriptional regulator GlxA family with amidase domain
MKIINVGMVIFPGFQLLDVAGPRDAFAEVKKLSGGSSEYRMVTIATSRSTVESSSGLVVVPEQTIFDACPEFDTVIFSGGAGIFDVFADQTLSLWLQDQAARSRRIAAICNGVFAFGTAGLIDGREVTTHWLDVARLGSTFPTARVEPDRIFVKDGNVYTTGGVTAGIDLALAFIEEDFGRKMALDIAKYLVVYLRRSAGQSQCSQLLELQAAPDSQIEVLQRFMLNHLGDEHSVATLARQANMSVRNLSRVFVRECGVAPMAFLNHARIDAARRLLESTDLTLKDIARRCGFDHGDGFRRMFQRYLQTSPADYRNRVQSADPSKRAVQTTLSDCTAVWF